jgi:hypothetical protein
MIIRAFSAAMKERPQCTFGEMSESIGGQFRAGGGRGRRLPHSRLLRVTW